MNEASRKAMEHILGHKIAKAETEKPSRAQKEIKALFSGKSMNKIETEVIDENSDGIITLKRKSKTYKVKKVDREPTRNDFIFFEKGEYESPWFKENCNNFFLVRKGSKSDSCVYFYDLKGFDCYLHKKYVTTYEVINPEA